MKTNRFHVPNGIPTASMRLSVFEPVDKGSICMSFSEATVSASEGVQNKEGLRVATEIKQFLEHAGWDVWYHKESIAGVPWEVQWKQRAEMALACILCLSSAWVESKACQAELQFLMEHNIHTIIVVVDENYKNAKNWSLNKSDIGVFGNWATRNSYSQMAQGIVFGNIERALIYHKYHATQNSNI